MLTSSRNITADIYRAGNAPPDDPDVTAAQGDLVALYRSGLASDEAAATTEKKFTHWFQTTWDTDVRDDWSLDTVGPDADTIYIPDKNGTGFKVVFVEFFFMGSPAACKRAYLSRLFPDFPTTNL